MVADPDWYNQRGAPKVLTADLRKFLSDAIDADPTLYLHELAARILATQGIRIGIQTLQVEIRDRLGLTLKVVLTVDPAQDKLERAEFLYTVSSIPVECLICFGESFGAGFGGGHARILTGGRSSAQMRVILMELNFIVLGRGLPKASALDVSPSQRGHIGLPF